MGRLRQLTLIAVLLAIVVFVIKNQKPSTMSTGKGLVLNRSWLVVNQNPITPKKDVRPADQTFLTFPEWFLVFSPAEQAAYLKINTSTTFPYMKHVDQLWKGYHVIYKQIKGTYKFNTDYHVMIWVIAVSTTVEYSIKSLYETIIGRLTNTSSNEEMTKEDRLNESYINRYTIFIKDLPWYEYDFKHDLKGLWDGTSFLGPHFLRKIERKYYLTTELLAKSAYAYLIKSGTKSAYNTALLNTSVVIDKLPLNIHDVPEIKNIRQLTNGSVLMDLPRYDKFNSVVCRLAKEGVVFKEIAGNNGAIMMTVLTNKPLILDKYFKVLFTQPIETKPGLFRVALVTLVCKLNIVLLKMGSNHINIEHIYDY